jgi:glucokinase
MSLIIAGDIGGTNARLCMYQVAPGQEKVPEKDIGQAHSLVFTKYYKNEDFSSFSGVVDTFLHDAAEASPKASGVVFGACFAVAGPVKNNQARMTNRGDWVISAVDLERHFNIKRVKLVNDFVANGFGLLTLNPDEYDEVHEATAQENAPIALVGAGTGLGECYLTCADGRFDCYLSEGGHADFLAKSQLQDELLQFLRTQFGTDGKDARVSVERVVSGKGIVNVYEFLATKFPDKVDGPKHKIISESSEGGRHISKMAFDYPLAGQAMQIVMSAYGVEAGNAALKFLPFGGLYICGGIAPNNMSYIADPNGPFLTGYKDKGRVSKLLTEIPVRIVRSEDLGLRGAHVVATRLLQGSSAATATGVCTNPICPGCACGANCTCSDSCQCANPCGNKYCTCGAECQCGPGCICSVSTSECANPDCICIICMCGFSC